MKTGIILVTVCALVILGAGFAGADDLSDMKEQIRALQETINAQQKTIESLNTKIQSVEAQQATQSKEVTKVPELEKSVEKLKASPPSGGLFEGLNIGGHLKFALLDRTEGKRNGVDQHNNLGGGFFGNHNVIFYISKQIEDWLKIEIDPEVDATASATPSVGSDISRDTANTWSLDIYQAYMTALLPKGYELRVGKFNPMFSENYAKELWWHDLFNIKPGLCSLVAYHDFGAELYKNYDFDKWSLPVYLNILNGVYKTPVDNNENKMVLVHVAPEFCQSKLKLLGSLAYGKQDIKSKHDQLFSLLGFEWKYQKITVLSEYIYKKYKNLVATGTRLADGKNEGFYIRAKYDFTPKWAGVLQYVDADLYKTGTATMKSDRYSVETVGLNYNLTPASTIMLDYEYGDGNRSDGSEKIKWDRFTLGWRTTF